MDFIKDFTGWTLLGKNKGIAYLTNGGKYKKLPCNFLEEEKFDVPFEEISDLLHGTPTILIQTQHQ
jgi:hypothetical protein